MKKSIMRLLAAVVLVAAMFAYQSEQNTVSADSCWWNEASCYTYGGFWMPTGAAQQCWNGTWNVQYICAYSAFGTMGPYWCDTGSQCQVCDPNEPGCNG